MADTPGMLSQALANLRYVGDELSSLGGLPEGADAARAQVVHGVGVAIPAVQATSKALLDFVAMARPLLASAMEALKAEDPDRFRSALAATQAGAALARSSIESSTAAVQTAIGDVNAQLAVLSGIDGTLARQIAEATAEARLAQEAADELEQKKYYWLLLGPFGLIGLGICIGMIVDASNKVSQMQGRSSALRGQAAQWARMKADVDLAISELPPVGSKLQSLQNGINFVYSDVSQVTADMEKGGAGSAIAKAFLMTAGTQLDILSQDAA